MKLCMKGLIFGLFVTLETVSNALSLEISENEKDQMKRTEDKQKETQQQKIKTVESFKKEQERLLSLATFQEEQKIKEQAAKEAEAYNAYIKRCMEEKGSDSKEDPAEEGIESIAPSSKEPIIESSRLSSYLSEEIFHPQRKRPIMPTMPKMPEIPDNAVKWEKEAMMEAYLPEYIAYQKELGEYQKQLYCFHQELLRD